MKRLMLLLLVCLCSAVQAANEIRSFEAGATTCYAVVREIDGDVWYPVGLAFEVWGTGGRTAADYDIALTNKTGGLFVGSFDTNISAGSYYVVTHMRVGASPANTDPAVWEDYGYWTGSAWTTSATATAPAIADSVWDEPTADHTGETTFGGEVGGLDPNVTAILLDTGTTLPATLAALPTTEQIRAEMDANSTQLSAILADTNELQGDWTDGGRLDLILDAVLVDTGTTLPAQIAALVVPDPAGTAAALHVTTDALISAISVPTTTQIADAVHDEVVEGTITLRQAMRLFLSVMTGKSSGGGTTNIKFRDIGDTKDRIDVTVDSKGNRTAVNTRDGS